MEIIEPKHWGHKQRNTRTAATLSSNKLMNEEEEENSSKKQKI